MEVIGYPNYLIYPDGRIQNKKSKRYLTAFDNGKGYLRIILYKDKKPINHYIHRLLGIHYIPNCENKPWIDHINRNTKDNRLENLRWATSSENGQNRGVQEDNPFGLKNISYDKVQDRYRYKKIIKGELHQKYFKTLEEAVEYKKEYEKNLSNFD